MIERERVKNLGIKKDKKNFENGKAMQLFYLRYLTRKSQESDLLSDINVFKYFDLK